MKTARVADWSIAYARQALSDLRAREILTAAKVDRCHKLHFLQMASEKTCKAYLSAGRKGQDVRRTHAYVAKVLPVLAKDFYQLLGRGGSIPAWQLAAIRQIATEIEVLAPACDAGDVRRDNCEYPWMDAQGTIQTPCDYKFSNIPEDDKSVVLLVKLLISAAVHLSQ